MDTKITRGEYIRGKMNQKGMTQERLAELVDVSVNTVNSWECGRRDIKPKNLEKLAAVLGVSVSEIMAGKDMDLNEQDKARLDQAIMELSERLDDTQEMIQNIKADALERIQNLQADARKMIQNVQADAQEKIQNVQAEAQERIQNVHEFTDKVDNRALISTEWGFYAFGLSISAFFLAWYAAAPAPKNPWLSAICLFMTVFGFWFMWKGKKLVTSFEQKKQKEKEQTEQ